MLNRAKENGANYGFPVTQKPLPKNLLTNTTVNGALLLVHLYYNPGGLSPSQLAKLLHTSEENIFSMRHALLKKGVIIHEPGRFYLTEAGQEWVKIWHDQFTGYNLRRPV